MAAIDFTNVVQGLYLSYYGRFADQSGMYYWTTRLDAVRGDLTEIIQAFGTSAEATAMLSGKTTAQQVNTIYQTLFGRDVDPTGLTYYTNLITSGEATLIDVAKRIYDGAGGDDARAIANKVIVANQLTGTEGAKTTYLGNDVAAAARNLMKTVTADVATKDTAVANAAATLSAASAPLAAATDPVTYINGGASVVNHFEVGDTIIFNFTKSLASISSYVINDAGVTTSHTHTFASNLVIATDTSKAYVVLGSGSTLAANDTITIVGVDQLGTSATVTFTVA